MNEDLKKYWNDRSPYVGKQFTDWIDDVVKIIQPKSVIEVGCGSGVWGDYFNNYKGYDYAIERIKNRPNLHYGDIVEGVNDKADLVFICMVLLHIREKDIRKAIENVKKISQNYIMIEPITYRTPKKANHVFYHNYFDLLPEAILWRVKENDSEDIGILVNSNKIKERYL